MCVYLEVVVGGEACVSFPESVCVIAFLFSLCLCVFVCVFFPSG